MSKRNCIVPVTVRLRGTPNASLLAELQNAITDAISGRLRLAERAIAARSGLSDWARHYEPPTIRFSGAALDDASAGKIASAIKAGIARAIGVKPAAAGHSLRPSSPFMLVDFRQQVAKAAPPAKAARPAQSAKGAGQERYFHVERRIKFKIRLDRMLDWIGTLKADAADFVKDQRALRSAELETVLEASVYVIKADKPVYLDGIEDEMVAHLDATEDEEYLYGYAFRRDAREALMSRAESGLSHLPDINPAKAGASINGRFYLERGGLLLFVVLPVPRIELADLASVPSELSFTPPIRELEFLVEPTSFERLLHVRWADYLAEFGDTPGELHARVIVPTKFTRFETLKLLTRRMSEQAVAEDAALFGTLFLLNRETLAKLPPSVVPTLDRASNAVTRDLDEPRRFGLWDPGWAGAFIYAVFRVSDLDRSVALHRPAARRALPEILAFLRRDPTEYDWGRDFFRLLDRRFERNPAQTRPDDGTDFEFVLDELKKQNQFDHLFDCVEKAAHFGAHQRVLRLTLATVYADDPRVRISQKVVRATLLRNRQNLYETSPGAVLLDRDSGRRVGIGGIFGETWGLYIFEKEKKRLKPALLPGFKKAMTDAAIKLLGEVARGTDKHAYSEQEFGLKVAGDAAAAIGLKEDDFEKVTVQRSMRLVNVEERVVDAVSRIFVTFKFVERIEGEGWVDVSANVTEIEDDFEARLIYWSLGRAGEFYETATLVISAVGLFAVAWEIGLVSALVAAAGGTGSVVFSIGLSELIYLYRVVFGDAKLTLRGVLEAALDGYLMALGFQGAHMLGRLAAGGIGTASLSRVVGGWVVEKMITGVVGGAGTAALTRFSHDLVAAALDGKPFSSLSEYVADMKHGAVFGLAMEFAGAPILKAVGRPALEALIDAKDIVRLLIKEGATAAQLKTMAVDAVNSAKSRLAPIIGDIAAEGFASAMGRRLAEIAEQMPSRFVAGRVLELAKVAITREASAGLEKLLAAAEFSPEKARAFFETLGKNPVQARIFLEVTGGLEPATVRRLLEGTFAGSPKDMADFVERLGRYSVDQQRAVMQLLSDLGVEVGSAPTSGLVRSTLLAEQGKEIAKRAAAAFNSGVVSERLFGEIKQDLLAWLRRVRKLHDVLRASGALSEAEFASSRRIIDDHIKQIEAARYTRDGRGLFLEAKSVSVEAESGKLGPLVESGAGAPGQTAPLAKRVPPALPAGPPKKGLPALPPGPSKPPALALPPGGGPAPRQLSFLESASGRELTPAEQAQATDALRKINRLALAELETRGSNGMAALSMLLDHQETLGFWPIESVRGLATVLELPRAVPRATLERFFLRSSDELAPMFEKFLAISDMPGANLVFRQNATRRAMLLIDLYRRLRGERLVLPDAMNEQAQRGMLSMITDLGPDGAVRALTTKRFRNLSQDRKLAELIANDSLTDPVPPVPIAQQILTDHAGDLVSGINLADMNRTPAGIRGQIEAYAKSHGASFDSFVLPRIEAAIERYQGILRRIQSGAETDLETIRGLRQNIDGTRQEFRALMLTLDRGAQILSFSSKLGAAAKDTFEGVIDVGWHPLRGRVTVKNAPREVPVQIDVLSRTVDGFMIEEVAFSDLGLPEPLKGLVKNSGNVTVDWSALNDEYPSHRKWKQVLKNIAFAEFGEEFGRSFGGTPPSTIIVVSARSATKDAITVLTSFGVQLVIHGQ